MLGQEAMNDAQKTDIPTNIDIDISRESLKESDNIYLKTVSDLGDTEDITAWKDIYSEAGVLLLSQGSRIDKKPIVR